MSVCVHVCMLQCAIVFAPFTDLELYFFSHFVNTRALTCSTNGMRSPTTDTIDTATKNTCDSFENVIFTMIHLIRFAKSKKNVLYLARTFDIVFVVAGANAALIPMPS